MRDLLSMRELFNESIGNIKLNHNQTTTVCRTIFKENNDTLNISLNPRITPRTKHIATKYHLFSRKVGNGTYIHIKMVSIQNKITDIFTKGFQGYKFTILWKLLMGW